MPFLTNWPENGKNLLNLVNTANFSLMVLIISEIFEIKNQYNFGGKNGSNHCSAIHSMYNFQFCPGSFLHDNF